MVQPGDSIDLIADKFGVTAISLIQNNELENPFNLITGQTIIIAYPEQTHIVQDGDTLCQIAAMYGVSLMQLLRNNPFLSGRNYIYPGEILTISYETRRSITTNGFCYPFINMNTLIKTLPFLTYLNIFNYRATAQGEISSTYDDAEVIRTAKMYGTAPIMMMTTLTSLGEPNLEAAYENLTTEAYQVNLINNALNLIRSRGFAGMNIVFTFVTDANVMLYENLTEKFRQRFQEEGFLFFVTINLSIDYLQSDITYTENDYSGLSQATESIMFMNFIWGINYGPPASVTSITALREFIDHAVTIIPPERIVIGLPILGYDWRLPYEAGRSEAVSLTINSTLSLAREVGADIQFDDVSMTPYFMYNQYIVSVPILHMVRFIDARTVDALAELIEEKSLDGMGMWNIMVYYAGLWLVLNSQYNIIKTLPDQLA